MMATVEQQFQKNSQLTKEDLDTMRDWIEKQPHLPKIPGSEIQYFLKIRIGIFLFPTRLIVLCCCRDLSIELRSCFFLESL